MGMELYLAPVKFSFTSSDKINLKADVSIHYNRPLINSTLELICNYSRADKIDLDNWDQVFVGESFDDSTIPYQWKVLKNGDLVNLFIDFYDHPTLLETSAILDLTRKKIEVQIKSKNPGIIEIDPLFHPLGSLLMVYMAHFTGGLLIHASGVSDLSNGYLFTGVSGIGKTTMSRLWKEKGAHIINDDRLWLHKCDNQWHIFNTPMLYYAQTPVMAPLTKAFILMQTPQNQQKIIAGSQGALRLMSNCIQHFYDKDMTAIHLDRIIEISSKIPIIELGFKPTTEVVGFIRNLQ